jgi:hypothetical protein
VISEELWDCVVPLLRYQSETGKDASLEDCVEQALWHGVRPDLVILLVRSELPLAHPDRSRLLPRFLVNVAASNNGAIHSDDIEALDALHLVAEALGRTLTVKVIDR